MYFKIIFRLAVLIIRSARNNIMSVSQFGIHCISYFLASFRIFLFFRVRWVNERLKSLSSPSFFTTLLLLVADFATQTRNFMAFFFVFFHGSYRFRSSLHWFYWVLFSSDWSRIVQADLLIGLCFCGFERESPQLVAVFALKRQFYQWSINLLELYNWQYAEQITIPITQMHFISFILIHVIQ